MEIDEDCAEALYVAEGYLARRLDGIVVAEDGVYDHRLQPLLTWS